MIYNASHIYINPQGVPCAPTKEYNPIWNVTDAHIEKRTYDLFITEAKQSAIPIREEDRIIALDILPTDTHGDTFYPVEPYEFEVESRLDDYSEISGLPSRYARIIQKSKFEKAIDEAAEQQSMRDLSLQERYAIYNKLPRDKKASLSSDKFGGTDEERHEDLDKQNIPRQGPIFPI